MSLTRDIAHRLISKQGRVYGASTSTWTSTVVDTGAQPGFESLAIELVLGAFTDATHTLTFEDSDDNSTFKTDNPTIVAIASGNAATYASKNTLFHYPYGKRYVRVKNTISGATSGMPTGLNYILGHSHHNPTAGTN